ncbi:alkene reductase [Amnibacterium kyonggiense]|uniref:2,4-dienoyl-CoA reductase-like NADH-dependent reductase (Old Yellow Enzyme family) n=1 Tax=Amnibacterium kyonggiense TaxID=595671 RepID=A0A4R7FLB5_9MICO|nr:alkene reductase [Amnibacterium kyonggiense]TDS77185.1 2,4-dienoyl-CoA reductase-like NADH-dependent reductase (Old Yellow Enzyme family) [Amnibacterium kyonggiense]
MDLFSPIELGDLHLANRVVMAPLTRVRSGADGVPTRLVAEYYAQRASVGLIVSEGVYPTRDSRGYFGQPGIVTDEQEAAWRVVTDAVHREGGRIVMQLMHSGRVVHPDLSETGRTVAPSAVAIDGETHTQHGKQRHVVPDALTAEELVEVRDAFVEAARRAVRAGFDGVELHGANGYLLHQFLSPVSNVRTDDHGGSPAARARFVVEVAEAVAGAIGAGRVGIRLSPGNQAQDVFETDETETRATYRALLDGLRPLGLAYLSVLHAEPAGALVRDLRSWFGGKLVINSGFGSVTTREEALALTEGAHADAVAVGRAIIANPDLVERWRAGAPENAPRPEHFYTAGAEGYTDYPRRSA